MELSSYKKVWDTLSQIDVTPFVEKKLNLSYLSWMHAWRILMEHFPNAVYDFPAPERHNDGTMTVLCKVTIPVEVAGGINYDIVTREMWLPVMDNRNNAIEDPDARDISDSKMRCLVKALAMLGLGHNLYAGEEFVARPPINDEQESNKNKKPTLLKGKRVSTVIGTPYQQNPNSLHFPSVSSVVAAAIDTGNFHTDPEVTKQMVRAQIESAQKREAVKQARSKKAAEVAEGLAEHIERQKNDASLAEGIGKERNKGNNEDHFKTAKGAEEVADKLLEFAKEFCASEDGLVDFWRKNKQIIDILDTNFPAQYEKLKNGFTELRKQITGA